MTSIERILASINHKQPDRVPIDLRFTSQMKARLLQYLGMTEAEFLKKKAIRFTSQTTLFITKTKTFMKAEMHTAKALTPTSTLQKRPKRTQ